MEAECRIYASVDKVSIGLDSVFSPVWRHFMIWTNIGLLLIGPIETDFSEI